jgi:hypothetical protein
MAVTKATILSLVSMLSCNLADVTEIDRLYGEVILDLGSDTRQWFTNFSQINPGTTVSQIDQESLELPAEINLARLIALFYNGRELSREAESTFETRSRHWHDRPGSPVAFTTDQRSDRFVRLYPKNDTFQNTEVGVLHTLSVRTTNVPEVMALPIAMLVLAREFERESIHRDMDFAKACRALGQEMLNYIVRTS